MIALAQQKGFDRKTAQAALRAGLRAVIRQPNLARWRVELSANTTSTTQELAWIPGAESIAMLAAMPLETRHATLETIDLTKEEQTRLHPIMDQLAGDGHATASRLMQALPYTAERGALLGMTPHTPDPSVTEAPFANTDETTLSLEERQQALTPAQRTGFRALTLFQFPVPQSVILAVLVAVGDTNPDETHHRLLALELVSRHEERHNNLEHFITEPLAHPLFPPPLTPAEGKVLAQAALPPLFAAWRKENGKLPLFILALEAFRLAQMAADPAAMEESAIAAGFWLFNTQHEARTPLAMVEDTVMAMNTAQIAPSPRLLNLGVQCANRLGEAQTCRILVEQAMALPQDDTVEWAELWGEYAEMLATEGDMATAEQWLRRAEWVFQQHDEIRSLAVTMGRIADILFQQGKSDEAMRIRQHEELPVFEKLGDIRERAITMGKIADILTQQGKLDEALRIRQNEQLPVFKKLGDIRERAITMGRIADILAQQGQLDEALRMQEECITVAIQLGNLDIHAHALFAVAQLRLSMEPTDLKSWQNILDNLSQSFAMNNQIGRADGIAVVGAFYGQVLAQAGKQQEAITVLEKSEAAFRLLQWGEQAQQVATLIRQIQNIDGTPVTPP